MKLQGKLSDGKYCERLYNIHTDSPILQQMEERQGRILDANYTKVDIDVMVVEYKKGASITLRKPGAILCTLALPQQGPYNVGKNYENGSITTELEPNVIGRVNIRRCHPQCYKLPEADGNDMNIQPTNTEVV